MSVPKPTPPPALARPSLHLNWEDWLPYLDDPNATEAEKRRLIEALWSIVIAFVDLGWEVASGTAAQETIGQVLDLRTALEAAVLNSKEHSTKEEACLPELPL